MALMQSKMTSMTTTRSGLTATGLVLVSFSSRLLMALMQSKMTSMTSTRSGLTATCLVLVSFSSVTALLS